MRDLLENLGGDLVQMLEAIKADNRSGAAEILREAAAVYMAAASRDYTGLSPEALRLIAERISSVLSEAQPGMAPVQNMISNVYDAVRRAGGLGALEVAARTASEFAESASRKTSATAVWGAQLIAGKSVVLTHSRSSTVLAALLNAARGGSTFSLIATESRPNLEGRQLAEAIASAGIHVTLIVDAAAALLIETVDLVVVGADRVTPTHVLNKIGTRMIALAARAQGIPVYVLADTSKFIAPGRTDSERADSPGAEVWPDAPAGISIINRYFEEVPIDLFTRIVTETGQLEPVEASRIAADSGSQSGPISLD